MIQRYWLQLTLLRWSYKSKDDIAMIDVLLTTGGGHTRLHIKNLYLIFSLGGDGVFLGLRLSFGEGGF